MLPFLAFIIVAAATRLYDLKQSERFTRKFRAMSPQDLKALYAAGGSLKIVTPLGRILRPVVMGIAAAIIVAIIF